MSQQLDALARATQVRHDRAQLRRALKHGDVLAHPVVREPPACAKTWGIYDFLRSIKGLGEHKASRIVRHVNVPPSKSLEALTDRQRRAVLEELEAR